MNYAPLDDITALWRAMTPAESKRAEALLPIVSASLRSEARTLLRRAVAYLDSHRREFPEYLPEKNILNRCTTDGGFVQIR